MNETAAAASQFSPVTAIANAVGNVVGSIASVISTGMQKRAMSFGTLENNQLAREQMTAAQEAQRVNFIQSGSKNTTTIIIVSIVMIALIIAVAMFLKNKK